MWDDITDFDVTIAEPFESLPSFFNEPVTIPVDPLLLFALSVITHGHATVDVYL